LAEFTKVAYSMKLNKLQTSKTKSLAQTELAPEVFIASTAKPETDDDIQQPSRTLRGVGSMSRRPGRAQINYNNQNPKFKT
jgi:hypothetical protein